MEVLRYTAFTLDPDGGNPAGVVLDARGADDAQMQAVAAEVGYSETAFLLPASPGRAGVRYFSPLAEVPFCGHATIAAAVALAERTTPGELRLATGVGEVRVMTAIDPAGRPGVLRATLTSVPPRTAELGEADLAALLSALNWARGDLDPALPPRVAFAGAWHPVVAARTRARLAELDYDRPALAALMAERDWTTVALVHRREGLVFDVRNPFPPGGVYEDPATGAAAAAFGGYLRELGLVDLPATLTLHQGDDLGRPSLLTVTVPVERGSGVAVSGTAIRLG